MSKVMINMKMPRSCSVCNFCSYIEENGYFGDDYYECVINGQFLAIEPDCIKRDSNCPLQEVKELV